MSRLLLIAVVLFPIFLSAQDFGLPWILPPKLTGLDEFSCGWGGDRFIRAKKNNHYGLLTYKGEILLDFEYDNISADWAGVIVATKQKKKFWFDAHGKQFGEDIETVLPLEDSHYAVSKNLKWGVMNARLKLVKPIEYEMKTGSQNVVLVRDQEEIDLGPLITPDGRHAGVLNEISMGDDWPGVTLYQDPKTFKKGIMGKDGKPVSPAIYYFKLGHAAGFAVASLDRKKWGIISRDNKIIADFQYDDIGRINDRQTALFKMNKQTGILDAATGQVLVAPGVYDDLLVENKAYEYYIIVKNGLQGICDARGKVILQPIYDKAVKSGPYLFAAQHLNSKFPQRSLFDLAGRLLYQADSVRLWVFDNGTLLIGRQDGTLLHQDLKGRVMKVFEPNTATPFERNWIAVEAPDKAYFYHENSTPEHPLVFDDISDAEGGLYRVRQGNLYGYMDNSGKLVVPLVLESAATPDNIYLNVRYKGKWGVLKNTYY